MAKTTKAKPRAKLEDPAFRELPEEALEAVQGETEDTSEVTQSAGKRVYRDTLMIDHDLYKLKVASMKKNIAWDGQKADIVRVEHTHFFHTVDSDGREQTSCTPTGGHFHLVEVLPGKEGQLPSLRISGPKKYVWSKKRGREVVPYSIDGEEDNHTHVVQYLRSERVKQRQVNPEYAKFESAQRSITDPRIEGVKDGG